MTGRIEILPVAGRVDARGVALDLPARAVAFLGRIAALHLVTIEPGAVRGNHRHRGRREALLVHAEGPWRLAWQHDGEPAPTRRDFPGHLACLVLIPEGVWHAIENCGPTALAAVSCASAGPTDGDTDWRAL